MKSGIYFVEDIMKSRSWLLIAGIAGLCLANVPRIYADENAKDLTYYAVDNPIPLAPKDAIPSDAAGPASWHDRLTWVFLDNMHLEPGSSYFETISFINGVRIGENKVPTKSMAYSYYVAGSNPGQGILSPEMVVYAQPKEGGKKEEVYITDVNKIPFAKADFKFTLKPDKDGGMTLQVFDARLADQIMPVDVVTGAIATAYIHESQYRDYKATLEKAQTAQKEHSKKLAEDADKAYKIESGWRFRP